MFGIYVSQLHVISSSIIFLHVSTVFKSFLAPSFLLIQDACSVVSDYDCPCAELSSSVEDLLDLSYSLKDSEYFKDLEGGIPASFTAPTERKPLPLGLQVSLDTDTKQPTHTSLSTHSHRVNAPSSPFYIHPAEEPHQNFVVTQLRPKLHPGCIIDRDECSGPAVGLSLTINLNGLPGSMETAKGITGSQEETEQGGVGLDGELDEDSFPILVRSMSTSRRHSLGVLISPITLGRRWGGCLERMERRTNLVKNLYNCTKAALDLWSLLGEMRKKSNV